MNRVFVVEHKKKTQRKWVYASWKSPVVGGDEELRELKELCKFFQRTYPTEMFRVKEYVTPVRVHRIPDWRKSK